ncbi:MAG: glycosyltransferase family 2 protein [Brevinema sp.]
MDNPKVSVIIPVYNVEYYLRECLDSVMNQTLKNIEIIIVNDCSPDNSEAIILEYQKKDSRIIYIKHEINKRQGGARNTGLRIAKGEWIYFMDSDDYINLNLLEKIINKCESIGANYGVFGRQDFGTFLGEKASIEFIPSKKIDGQILNQDTMYDVWITICTRIFKRSDLIKNNLFFLENFFMEDLVFAYQYAVTVGPKIASLQEKAYHYRRHDMSTMGQINKNIVYLPLAFKIIVEFLKKFQKWEQYKDVFLRDVPNHMFSYFIYLDPNFLGEYMKNFIDFCKVVDPSPKDIEQFPVLCFAHIESMLLDQQKVLLMYFIRNWECINDKWYRFGQASCIEKIKMFLKFIMRKILKTS